MGKSKPLKEPALRRVICSDNPQIEEIERPNMKIRSRQAVYLDASRKKAVPENHPDAAFLLVGSGCEIDEKELAKYDGAEKHVAAEAKPYSTVSDTRIVGGKEVEGSKVKVDPANQSAPNPSVEAETDANPPPKTAKRARAKKASAKK